MAKPKPPVPDDLTLEEKRRLHAWAKNHERREVRALVPRLRELVDDCLSHHAAKGNPGGYVDWYAACRNWITRQPAKERERLSRWREEELPQEPRAPGEEAGELVRLSDFPLFARRGTDA